MSLMLKGFLKRYLSGHLETIEHLDRLFHTGLRRLLQSRDYEVVTISYSLCQRLFRLIVISRFFKVTKVIWACFARRSGSKSVIGLGDMKHLLPETSHFRSRLKNYCLVCDRIEILQGVSLGALPVRYRCIGCWRRGLRTSLIERSKCGDDA